MRSEDVIGLTQDQIWDDEAAQAYDGDDGMADPALLDATTSRLAALAEGGRALELAVGTGRVAVPLLARGVPVDGIELSAAMLRRLREKVDDARLPVVHGDMATATAPAGPGGYALVYLVFNTISNLLDQDEQVACFRNAARHLRPGGRFVVELGVPDLRHLTPGRTATVFTDQPGYLGVDTYDPVRQLLVSHHVRFGQGRQAWIGRSPHRYVWPAELDLMGRLAGLDLQARDADWAGAPFTADSGSHVSVYRRRDG